MWFLELQEALTLKWSLSLILGMPQFLDQFVFNTNYVHLNPEICYYVLATKARGLWVTEQYQSQRGGGGVPFPQDLSTTLLEA